MTKQQFSTTRTACGESVSDFHAQHHLPLHGGVRNVPIVGRRDVDVLFRPTTDESTPSGAADCNEKVGSQARNVFGCVAEIGREHVVHELVSILRGKAKLADRDALHEGRVFRIHLSEGGRRSHHLLHRACLTNHRSLSLSNVRRQQGVTQEAVSLPECFDHQRTSNGNRTVISVEVPGVHVPVPSAPTVNPIVDVPAMTYADPRGPRSSRSSTARKSSPRDRSWPAAGRSPPPSRRPAARWKAARW